jgi:hypothetical protein
VPLVWYAAERDRCLSLLLEALPCT